MLLTVGSREIFRPGCERFREKATAAGVGCLEEPGLFYGWPIFPLLPESTGILAAIADLVQWQPVPKEEKMVVA